MFNKLTPDDPAPPPPSKAELKVREFPLFHRACVRWEIASGVREYYLEGARETKRDRRRTASERAEMTPFRGRSLGKWESGRGWTKGEKSSGHSGREDVVNSGGRVRRVGVFAHERKADGW